MPAIWTDVHISPSESAGETGEGEGGPVEVLKSTCQHRRGDHFLLTSPRSEERLGENCTWSRSHFPWRRREGRRGDQPGYGNWSWWYSLWRRGGGLGGIWASQGCPGCHLRHLWELQSAFMTLRPMYFPDKPARRIRLPSRKRSKTSAHA